jgi:hypothetical protein
MESDLGGYGGEGVARYPREVDSMGPLIPPPCFHPQGATGG